MCGIAGFSLTGQSKINARKLTHALMCQIEKRGNQASGYAWQSGKESGVYKKDVPGSRLSTWNMPRRAKTAILHTRMATHGTIKDMNNNHPVMSPNGNIALVHNGVIYNHDRVRKELPYNLPEVDTSVIPAILQKYGQERFDMLDGDAAIAWLDDKTPGKLHMARVSHSPLWIANLKDGSFIFASTELILCTALDSLGLDYEWVQEVPEYSQYTIVNGVITDFNKLPETSPEYEDKLVYSPSYYRNITSGSTAGNNWYDSKIWASDEDEVELEDVRDFNDYLAYFYEIEGEFFDIDGAYVGTRETLQEDYEEWRYLKTLERNEKGAWGRMDEVWY